MLVIKGLFTIAGRAQAESDIYTELHFEPSTGVASLIRDGQEALSISEKMKVIEWSESRPHIYLFSAPQILSKITYREATLYCQSVNSQGNFYPSADKIDAESVIECFKGLPESLAALGASAWQAAESGESTAFFKQPETQVYVKIFSNSPWALPAFLENIHPEQWPAVFTCFPESIFEGFFKDLTKLKTFITSKEELAIFISLFPSKAARIRSAFEKELKEWIYDVEGFISFIARSKISDSILSLVPTVKGSGSNKQILNLLLSEKDLLVQKINKKQSLEIVQAMDANFAENPLHAEFVNALLKKMTYRDLLYLTRKCPFLFKNMPNNFAAEIYLNCDAHDLMKRICEWSGLDEEKFDILKLPAEKLKAIILKESGLKQSNVLFGKISILENVFQILSGPEFVKILGHCDSREEFFLKCLKYKSGAKKLEEVMVYLLLCEPVDFTILSELVTALNKVNTKDALIRESVGLIDQFKLALATDYLLTQKIDNDKAFKDKLLSDFAFFLDIFSLLNNVKNKESMLSLIWRDNAQFNASSRRNVFNGASDLVKQILDHQQFTPEKFNRLFEKNAKNMCGDVSVLKLLLTYPKASLLYKQGIKDMLDTETRERISFFWSPCIKDICFHPVISETVYEHPNSSLLLEESRSHGLTMKLAADAYAFDLRTNTTAVQIYFGLTLMLPGLMLLLLFELSINFEEGFSPLIPQFMINGFYILSYGYVSHLGGKCIVRNESWPLLAFNIVLLGFAALSIASLFDNVINDVATTELFDKFNCKNESKILTQAVAISCAPTALVRTYRIFADVKKNNAKLAFFKPETPAASTPQTAPQRHYSIN